jgi:hypothetical protein
MNICSLFPQLELTSIYHAIIAGTKERSWQHSKWGIDVILVWKRGIHVWEWLMHLEVCACHGSTQQLHFPLQHDWRMLPPFTPLNHYMLV